MIEIILRRELEQLLGLPVFMEYPDTYHAQFVLLRKGGRERENRIDTSRFMLNSYAPSEYEAAVLNERVCAALEKLEELDIVSGIHLITDYPYPDEKNKRHRYQAVYDITHY